MWKKNLNPNDLQPNLYYVYARKTRFHTFFSSLNSFFVRLKVLKTRAEDPIRNIQNRREFSFFQRYVVNTQLWCLMYMILFAVSFYRVLLSYFLLKGEGGRESGEGDQSVCGKKRMLEVSRATVTHFFLQHLYNNAKRRRFA